MPAYWNRLLSAGLQVPTDRPLDDLTAELVTMLGSPDPAQRDGIAHPALTTWIERGVYDDLLVGLGDGMVTGLRVGIGEHDTDSVFRRSSSVLVLAGCVARDNTVALLPAIKILEWGDRIATWFLREQDVRGFVPGRGWAHSVAHGADALRELAHSSHFAVNELIVLLDVIAERVLTPMDRVLTSGEPDRLASAVMSILRRDLVPLEILEAWVETVADAAGSRRPDGGDPFLTTGNPEALLRAVYLQLSLAPNPPAVRPDLLLHLVDALRHTNPHDLLAPTQGVSP